MSLSSCSIADCCKPSRGHGFCSAHYERWKKHGDPLGGRTPNGESARYLEDVVLAYDGDECLTWPFFKNENGYGWMRYEGVPQIVSRIICQRVHGPAPTSAHEAAHSCGKGHEACVTKGHLSWKTRAGNAADMVAHGNSHRGERSPVAKLTEAAVLRMRGLKGTVSQKEISRMFGVTPSMVSLILSGKAWGHLC